MMDPKDFCYWLRGVICNSDSIQENKLNMIKSKLNEVFDHEVDKNKQKPNKQYYDDGVPSSFELNNPNSPHYIRPGAIAKC